MTTSLKKSPFLDYPPALKMKENYRSKTKGLWMAFVALPCTRQTDRFQSRTESSLVRVNEEQTIGFSRRFYHPLAPFRATWNFLTHKALDGLFATQELKYSKRVLTKPS
jgi:hypothetical protein